MSYIYPDNLVSSLYLRCSGRVSPRPMRGRTLDYKLLHLWALRVVLTGEKLLSTACVLGNHIRPYDEAAYYSHICALCTLDTSKGCLLKRIYVQAYRMHGSWEASARLVLAGGVFHPCYTRSIVICITTAHWCNAWCRPALA